jgi:arabinogalactan endo-1,4-beta-galactosidase
MEAPRGGWLVAGLLAAALLAAFSLSSGTAIDSATIDLRHRWVALTAPKIAASDPLPGRPTINAIGMNVFLEQEVEPDKRQLSLELLKAAGVAWIRQELPWEQIEPLAKGQTVDPKFGDSTWAKFDDIVDRAKGLGLAVVLRLDTSPRWALPPDAIDGLGPPQRYEDYWDFVEQVAQRYRGRVRAYQVWNEPNLTIEWGRRPPDPAGYARLLAGAAERIRRADPNAQIVMAALAPTLSRRLE